MSTPELPFPTRSESPLRDETRPGFRTKTIATRLTQGELAEVEATAENAGQSLSEWLRDTALQAARQRPADPIELLLAEVWALRYTLLNLFHSKAKAASEGTQLLPYSIVKIRDQADAMKLQKAHKILADFLALDRANRVEK
ncbi:MAG: hypothetical protein WBQ72_11435 [Terriglobales bacterium]|jgi:hypothetical protein